MMTGASVCYLCLTLWCWILVWSCSQCKNLSRRKILEKLLDLKEHTGNLSYDPKIPPHYDEDYPTNVSIQLHIISVDSLNEVTMDFSVNVFLRQVWVDPRLRYGDYNSDIYRLELDQKLMNSVWVPDTYFANEKEAFVHDVTVPNKLLHIYKNGTVFYSMRVTMTISCEMNLHNYPLDNQDCKIIIESYGYSRENVNFIWHDHDPVLVPSVGLPQFFLSDKPKTGRCPKLYGEMGMFACLNTTLHFKRNTGYYFAQIFVPSILIVTLSWVSFWVDADATPARISLGVLTVLTMTTQTSGVRAQLPMVSYIKAIDIWMSTCMVFVFAALLEFAYINVVSRRKNRPVTTKKDCELAMITEKNPNPMMPLIKMIDFKRQARKVDRVSRVLFPSMFIVFNIGFWVYFLLLNKNNTFT